MRMGNEYAVERTREEQNQESVNRKRIRHTEAH